MWIIEPEDLIEPGPTPVIWIDDVGAVALNEGVLSFYVYSLKDTLSGEAPLKTLEAVIKRPAAGFIRTVTRCAQIAEACYDICAVPSPPIAPKPKIFSRPTLVR